MIFERLSQFNPALVGSFPICVNLPSSDVDILCETKALSEFKEFALKIFSREINFSMIEKAFSGIETIVIRFQSLGFTFELFAQNTPVANQKAFIHLEAEEKLLNVFGEMLRETVIQFKEHGNGTEKSFALAFGINSNEYEFIEKIHNLKIQEIKKLYSLNLPGNG